MIAGVSAANSTRVNACELPAPTVERAIEIVDVALCHSADDRLARDWITGDPVKASEPIAIREDGTRLLAPSDGFVIFPDANARSGSEWFYFGVAGRLGA